MATTTRLLIFTWLALALIGCSRLPHYARPVTVDASEFKMEDVIYFRQLERTDFRGNQPPAGFDRRMAATICSQIKPLIDMEYVGREDGKYVYLVKFREPGFRAIMDRDCSWWNPDVGLEEQDYILEHESIHFALSEIAAREWSEALPWKQVRISGLDEAELMRDLESKTNEFFQRRRKELLQRNLEFDEETSAVYDPERQKSWRRLVQAELSSSETAALLSTGRKCEIDRETRQTLKSARLALRQSNYRKSVLDLVDEAERAASLPECDPVRARIVADKAIYLANDPGGAPCLVDRLTRRSLEDALEAGQQGEKGAEVEVLLQQATDALEPPQCDPVRARILVDKANQLTRQ